MPIQNKAMIAHLHISTWTARKFDRRVTREIEDNYAASNSGRYNKILIATEYLGKIQKIASTVRAYHYENTLPWMDNGGRLLPTANYFGYVQRMDEYRAEFLREVNAFLDSYPDYQQEAKSRLNGMYSIEDYPDIDRLRDKYAFSVRMAPIADADDFRVTLNDEDVETIREDYRQQLEDGLRDAHQDLWKRLHGVVWHMLERLTTADARFKNSLVENIRDICRLMPKLNITEDPLLDSMVDEIKRKLTVHAPEVLRSDPEIRSDTALAAKQIIEKMRHYAPLREAS